MQLLPQDEQAKATAERTIEESAAKIDRKHAEIEEHEANLKMEEDVLESIRDSLKGASYICAASVNLLILCTCNRQDAGIPRSDRGQAERAPALDYQHQCKEGSDRCSNEREGCIGEEVNQSQGHGQECPG